MKTPIICLPSFNRGLFKAHVSRLARSQPIGLCHVGTFQPIAAHSEEENLDDSLGVNCCVSRWEKYKWEVRNNRAGCFREAPTFPSNFRAVVVHSDSQPGTQLIVAAHSPSSSH